MENIIDPNEQFDFSKMTLAHPIGIQGGAYFTKIQFNNKPLYIQTTKSLTRQGFIKTGKKYYCDLMFDNNSEVLINWFENLEERCKKLIIEKKDTWFQNSLEENDIESAFNSIIRIYRSGKFYLVRTNVKNTHLNEPAIKIYSENSLPLSMDDVTQETNIISILEIQGIKFTTRNFQIEIELKQMMVLDNDPVFDNCLIKSNRQKKEDTYLEIPRRPEVSNIEDKIPKNKSNTLDDSALDAALLEVSIENTSIEKIPEDITIESLDELIKDETKDETKYETKDKDNEDKTKLSQFTDTNDKKDINNDNILLNFEIEDLNDEVEEEVKELKEFDLDINLENNTEKIKLKKPNQVYFELYKEARTRAKNAKKNAILAYLEAKNIKKTYMIDNMNDSDSDFDAEIDEVSESELEGL